MGRRVDSATPPEPAAPSDMLLCPRCSSAFDCGRHTGGCWCADVMLDDQIRGDIALFYQGCLCPECLRTLEKARPPKPNVWEFLRTNRKRSR
jgi:hypothetical protein